MSSLHENINRWMYDKDAFSQHMGMTIVAVEEGKSIVQLTVTDQMTNGFGMAHGGITYSLADSAFAFACNSFGAIAVSVETSISHVKKVEKGDILTAHASMIHRSRKLGLYSVKIYNQRKELVADFKGTCYHTGKEHESL